MTKLIVVSGTSNTGKTSAIKEAMCGLGIHVGTPRRDVLLSAYVHLRGGGFHIGFATGGDSPEIVEGNIEYFESLWSDFKIYHDFIVLARRSRGQVNSVVDGFANRIDAEVVTIHTLHNPNAGVAISSTARKILNALK